MTTHKNISWPSSIRNRFLIFTILVTLLPSLGMGWFFYTMTYKAMARKTEQKLVDSAGKVEGDLNLWLRGQDQDLQAFASSSVLVDNLTKYRAGKEGEAGTASTVKKVAAYLTLLKNQSPDYRRLAVFDGAGHRIAASEGPEGDPALTLPPGLEAGMTADTASMGQAFSRKDEPGPLVVIGLPLYSEKHDARIGVLLAEIRLQRLLPLLKTLPADGEAGPGTILLVQKDGHPLLTAAFPEGQQETALLAAQKRKLFTHPFQLRTFNNGKWIVGLAVPFKDLPWGLVISESYDYVFADVIRSRDRIILTAILCTLLTGLAASLVAGLILPPLDALRRGALRVAEGDLDVSLDIRRKDEFGLVTGVFNQMAARLKQDKEELERLVVTDALTRLANRKRIMEGLKTHIEYYRRYGTDFSLLLIDIDDLQAVNDTYGHLVGDFVLVQMAEILTKTLRTTDTAGRYGGEEFLIILGQTTLQQAMLTAERVRQAVEGFLFVYQDAELHVSISTGVTGIKGGDDTDNTLMGRADKALQEAKSQGRGRIALNADTPSIPGI